MVVAADVPAAVPPALSADLSTEEPEYELPALSADLSGASAKATPDRARPIPATTNKRLIIAGLLWIEVMAPQLRSPLASCGVARGRNPRTMCALLFITLEGKAKCASGYDCSARLC